MWTQFCWDALYNQYNGTFKPAYVVVGDGLKKNQVRVSENYKIPSTGYGLIPNDLKKAFVGQGCIHIEQTKSGIDAELKDAIEQNMSAAGYEEDSEEESSEDSEDGDNEDGIKFDIEYVEDFSKQGADFIEVSPAIYRKLRDYYNIGTTQASVYIANYSKTDKVISALKEKGYDAVSTLRVSSTRYMQDKVYKRLEVIGISCMILIILAILQILIVRSILKIKKKDYSVLRFMGMRRKQFMPYYISGNGGSWYRGSYRDVDRDADPASGRRRIYQEYVVLLQHHRHRGIPGIQHHINAFDGIFL